MASPIRVLHVFNQMNYGGAETLIMNIYRNLDRSNFQFDFVVSVSDRGAYDDEIEALGGRLFRLPQPSEGIIPFSKAFDRILKVYGPFQVVHSHVHYFSGVTTAIAYRNQIPVRISHSHSTSDGQTDSLLRQAYRFIMKRLIHKHSTHLLGCSREACRAFLQKDERVQVFCNAIDIQKYHPSHVKGMLRKELKLSEEVIIIGHVGRFVQQKNHRKLIESFEAIHKKNPAYHLVLVGEGKLKPKMKQKVDEKNLHTYVHFLGVRDDISSLMKDFDVFLFPSLNEGLGIVLIEAQAAGLNCVASASVPKEAAVIEEMVKFIPLEAPNTAWTQAIEEALNQSTLSFQDRFEILTQQGYNIDTSVKRLEQIYGKCY